MMAVLAAVVSCTTEKKEPVNPFFTEWNTPFGVPPFDKIKNEHYMPAADSAIAIAKTEIAAITGSTDSPTFANTVATYDRIGQLLNKMLYLSLIHI